MEGWIKIHRKIKDHWLWNSDHRLKWWIDILLTVNHADTKVLIKGKLIECKRGQSIRSLETWAKDWNVTKKTVKEYFELLQKDSMLVYESIKISTRITVSNYDDYQDILNGEYTDSKRTVNGEYTDTTPKQECKEGIKNVKKEKKYCNIPPKFDEIKIRIEERQITSFTAEKFFYHYESNGWMVGKNKMKNWDATLTTWNSNKNQNNGQSKQLNSRGVKASNSDWGM